MNFIIDSIAADPSIDQMFRAAVKPQFFQARTGRRRTFLSQNGAALYDKGFSEYISGTAPVMDQGPYSDGAWDAFSADEERAMESLEVEPEQDE